jgi:hypothetical protein
VVQEWELVPDGTGQFGAVDARDVVIEEDLDERLAAQPARDARDAGAVLNERRVVAERAELRGHRFVPSDRFAATSSVMATFRADAGSIVCSINISSPSSSAMTVMTIQPSG